jgi:hypothetical protein
MFVELNPDLGLGEHLLEEALASRQGVRTLVETSQFEQVMNPLRAHRRFGDAGGNAGFLLRSRRERPSRRQRPRIGDGGGVA